MQSRPKRRHERLNDLLRDQLSDLLHHHTRDPRLAAMVSITDVELSPDLRYAKVFASIMGEEQEQIDALRALRGAGGYLRRELGERVRMRHTPELRFEQDSTLDRGARVTQLLRDAELILPDPPPNEA